MAHVQITRPDGSSSPYFWSDKETGDKAHMTVYKKTEHGITRMKGVHFDAIRKKVRRD